MPPGGTITSDSDLESVLSLQVEIPKVRRNSIGPKYYCSIEGCGQNFKRLDHLDRHEYKHTGIKKHACHYDGCTKDYTIVTHLKRHIRSTHERDSKEPIKNVPCDVDTCDKFFTSITNMQRHIREVHENPKEYKCQHCNEKFTQKLKMRRHEISKHTGVYPYNCEKCSKGFYQQWQWEKHEPSCKVYMCPTCDEQFDKWSIFQKHCKETQHSRKCYKCEYCNKVYIKPGELQKHIGTKHLVTDKKSTAIEFKCSFDGCSKSYAYERNLRQHISITHEGKKFECTDKDCDKVFSSLQNLQKHLNRDHDTESSKNVKEEPAKKEKSKSLKRKKRKDAGTTKVSNLAQLSDLAVDKDLNKRLKSRDYQALEEVTLHLSQELDSNSNSEDEAKKNENTGIISTNDQSNLITKDPSMPLNHKEVVMETEKDMEPKEQECVLENLTTLDIRPNEELNSLMESVLMEEHA